MQIQNFHYKQFLIARHHVQCADAVWNASRKVPMLCTKSPTFVKTCDEVTHIKISFRKQQFWNTDHRLLQRSISRTVCWYQMVFSSSQQLFFSYVSVPEVQAALSRSEIKEDVFSTILNITCLYWRRNQCFLSNKNKLLPIGYSKTSAVIAQDLEYFKSAPMFKKASTFERKHVRIRVLPSDLPQIIQLLLSVHFGTKIYSYHGIPDSREMFY